MTDLTAGKRLVDRRRGPAGGAGIFLIALTAIVASPHGGSTAVAAGFDGELTETVSVPEAVDRNCFERQLEDSAGVASSTIDPKRSSDDLARIDVRLDGPVGSDWDVAVFDASGATVAAGASRSSSEAAAGFVTAPGELTVQACHIAGTGTDATVSIASTPFAGDAGPKSSLAHVETPTESDRQLLTSLGLDLTEHGGDDYVAVVLHGAQDRAALDKAGLEYEVDVANLARQSANQRAADERYAARTQRSPLPSGSDTYRRLFEFTQELKDLADANPAIVRPITLNHETYEGRPVEGIEITTDPNNLRDGKPVFLQMGAHHAREWPSAEHAMEWAYELVNGYNQGNARVVGLVENVRTIVIPVVNPDGFETSREAGEALGHGNGQDGTFLTSFPTAPNEYRRKNCRLADDSEAGDCAQPAVGIKSFGVDPNRNYGGFWGGPGASDVPIDEDYRGPGPFSEPETKNVRELVSSRQVTTLITNHTFSNLVLRPPSIASDPLPVDETMYKALGAQMAAENGYLNQASYELYDTSGGTEDWSYYATGGLGFTFEIGCNHVPDPLDDRCSGDFHPTYPNVVNEYEGNTVDSDPPGGGDGGGNREAYFIAMEHAAAAANHSLIEGTAPAGAILKIEKTFETPTRNEAQPSFEDHLESELEVPSSGSFQWHINPSTRPLVAQARGRPALGIPSDPLEPTPATGDNTTTTPAVGCTSIDTTDPNCWNDHAFVVPGGAGVDNDSATVSMTWTDPVNDWDMKVFRDTDGDGTSVTETDADEVGQSGNSPPGTSETTTFVRPETSDGRLEPGNYVVRAINYTTVSPDPYDLEVSFEGPEEFVPPRTETWKLTCSVGGQVVGTQELLIARGERRQIDPCGSTPGGGGGDPDPSGACSNAVIGTKSADKLRGTEGSDRLSGKGGADRLAGRGGDDCVRGGAGKDRLKGNGDDDEIKPGRGADRVKGGAGSDTVRAARGGRDRIDCGPGRDKAIINAGKDRTRRCEKVKKR